MGISMSKFQLCDGCGAEVFVVGENDKCRFCELTKIIKLRDKQARVRDRVIEKAERVIRFYADKENWHNDERRCPDLIAIIYNDLYSNHVAAPARGGKKARQYFKDKKNES
jgi:hypothetical protein